jgi:diketogulonate reductase-like aldo/keto reductase
MSSLSKAQVVLNNGNEMPQIGFGTYELDDTNMKIAIEACIRSGLRSIDCASQYANQSLVGEALQYCMHDLKLVDRNELFITSKLWCTHHGKYVREACERTLKELQLDYLDLYLIHYPIALEFNGWDLSEDGVWNPKDNGSGTLKLAHTPLYETWREMEKLVEDGLVKNIGVSNYSIALLCDLMSYATIKPVVNQIEVHPYFTNKTLIEQAKSLYGIHTVAFSPFGKGAQSKILEDPVVNQIAHQYGKSPAQIIMRWNYEKGIGVIYKSCSPERVKQNADIFNFQLSAADRNKLYDLNKNRRVVESMTWLGIDLFQ